MIAHGPLYSSRIVKNYLQYLRVYYPALDLDAVLSQAGMTRYEVEDSAHWFTQQQTDRFHQIAVAMTGNPNLSREAGRFIASARGMGPAKQVVLGLMSVKSVFLLLEKIFPLMTRGTGVQIKKLGSRKLEVICIPKPGVNEKPYQCDNRIGIFESLPKLFTHNYAKIEHPGCIHRGDKECRYLIQWNRNFSITWKQLRNGSLLFGILFLGSLAFFGATAPWLLSVFGWFSIILGFSYLAEYTANKELQKIIESLGDSAKEQLDESIIRYSNARLVQEIGKASSTSLAIDAFLKNLMRVMQSHLRYDRGLIMLADREETRLMFATGFGYSGEETAILQQTDFDLENPDAQNLFVATFKTQRPLLAKKSDATNTVFAPEVNKIFEKIGLEETVCVPLVYEKQALGILAVDNLVSKAAFTESDMNLLQGIASQIAIGLNHAALFEKLQQSEQKFRQTIENIEEGYFEVDLKGNFTFVNTPLCTMTGYSREELTRMRYDDFAASDTARQMYHVFNRIYRTGESLKFAEFDVIKKNGTSLSVELSASLMKNSAGDTVGFRGIICDISERLETEEERRKLETHLQQIQKLESIGKLASGIAHNLNNMLMGIQGNSSLIRLEIDPEDRTSKRIADIENIIENASKLIGQIHGYARGGKFKINTVNLK